MAFCVPDLHVYIVYPFRPFSFLPPPHIAAVNLKSKAQLEGGALAPHTQQRHRRTPTLELQSAVELKAGCLARAAYPSSCAVSPSPGSGFSRSSLIETGKLNRVQPYAWLKPLSKPSPPAIPTPASTNSCPETSGPRQAESGVLHPHRLLSPESAALQRQTTTSIKLWCIPVRCEMLRPPSCPYSYQSMHSNPVQLAKRRSSFYFVIRGSHSIEDFLEGRLFITL